MRRVFSGVITCFSCVGFVCVCVYVFKSTYLLELDPEIHPGERGSGWRCGWKKTGHELIIIKAG